MKSVAKLPSLSSSKPVMSACKTVEGGCFSLLCVSEPLEKRPFDKLREAAV